MTWVLNQDVGLNSPDVNDLVVQLLRHVQLCTSVNCSTPGLPVLHYLPEFAQTLVHLVGDFNPIIIISCPLFLLPSVFPIIRIFSSELAFLNRWPKYWSFSFSINPSNEYSGLISFRIDWPSLHEMFPWYLQFS